MSRSYLLLLLCVLGFAPLSVLIETLLSYVVSGLDVVAVILYCAVEFFLTRTEFGNF